MINPKKKKRPYLDYDLEGYIKGQQTARIDATSNQQATTQRQVAENNTSEKVQQRKVANERRKTQEAYEKGKRDYEKQQQAAKVQEDIESRPWWNPTTVLRNAKDIPIFGVAPTATEWAYGLMNKAVGNDAAGDYYMQDADKSATGQAIALAAIPAHTNPYTAAMYDTALLAPWAKELDAQGKFYHPETLTGEEAAMLGLSVLPFGLKYKPQLSYAKAAAEDAALQSSIPWIRDNARGLYLSRAINQAADQGVQAPIKVNRTVERDGTIRMSLPSHTNEQPRQFVIDPQGNNKYYIHMKTWDGKKVPANLSAAEKNALFESVYNELPEGAEILFPKSSEDYLATRGTVAGLQRLSRDKRFSPGQEGTLLYYDDKTRQTKTYTGTSFIKDPQQSATQYVIENSRPMEPRTSLAMLERGPARISEAERAGIPKGERNNISQWHIANYPGYQLKGLMSGSPLERQLSKAGTININQLNAYFNKASQIEREVANKVLTEKFAGQKTIDYNQFKKAVQDELIGKYNRVPQTKYADYGMDRLGFETQFDHDGATIAYNPITEEFEQVAPFTPFRPNYQLNTFTFESPKISVGNNKHYDPTTLGHSRTYTTLEEPKVLHVMESQSDWGQSHVKMMPSVQAHQIAIEKALKSGNINAFHSFTNRLSSLMRDKLTKYEKMALENINKEIESGQPSGFQTIEDLWNKKYEILKKASNRSNIGVQGQHLHDNYLQRQLQENLRYAAENGQTKMRYPTSETAAKIEGYQKTINPKYQELLNKQSELHMELNELQNQEALYKMFNEPFSIEDNLQKTYKIEEELKSIQDEIQQIRKNGIEKTYIPEHQTILKKYADFPKLFQKLYKGQNVRTVTDAKGNSWYEVDVPKGYLNREWQYKKGGRFLPPWR